jgi:hypothetical protein
MKLVTVESSMIHAVGYDDEAEELEIVFNSGESYRYTGVPRSVYEGLLAADSKGRYLRAHVIGVYPEYRLSRRSDGR